MRPSRSFFTTSTPFFFDVWKSCRRSGSGTSSIFPVIDDDDFFDACAAATASRFAFTAVWSISEGNAPDCTSFRMEVPMRMRSPSFRRACLIFSPLTKVPLVEPKSSMVTLPDATVIFACLRETMSSTSTMSSSLERPITSWRSSAKGSSPPWYLPAMNLSA